MVNARLVQLLSQTTVKSLISQSSHKDLILMNANATLKESCQTLSEHKISSCPVVDKENILGVLEYSDLVKYVLQTLHKVPKEQAIESDISMVRPWSAHPIGYYGCCQKCHSKYARETFGGQGSCLRNNFCGCISQRSPRCTRIKEIAPRSGA